MMFSQHYMGLVFASLALLQPGDAKVTDDERLWFKEIKSTEFPNTNKMDRYTFAITTQYSDSMRNPNRELRNTLVCELSACYTLAKEASDDIGPPMAGSPQALGSWKEIEEWVGVIGNKLGMDMGQLTKDIAVATELHLGSCSNCETYPSKKLQNIRDGLTAQKRALRSFEERLQAAAVRTSESWDTKLVESKAEKQAKRKASVTKASRPVRSMIPRTIYRQETTPDIEQHVAPKHEFVSENKKDSEKKIPSISGILCAASAKFVKNKPKSGDTIKTTDEYIKEGVFSQTLKYKKDWVGKLGKFDKKKGKWSVTWEKECVQGTKANQTGSIKPGKFEVIKQRRRLTRTTRLSMAHLELM